jgi:hypothetical protein
VGEGLAVREGPRRPQGRRDQALPALRRRLKPVERGTRKAGDADARTETLILTHEGSKAE